MPKLTVDVTEEIMSRFVLIAHTEFGGNLSQYIRVTLWADLVRRDMLSSDAFKILQERTEK